MGTLSVLDADWSVITKYRGVFDLMNIHELSLSVTATVGRLFICRVGTDQLLASDINPSVVTRTFVFGLSMLYWSSLVNYCSHEFGDNNK